MKTLATFLNEARNQHVRDTQFNDKDIETRFTFAVTKKGSDWRIDFCLIPITQFGHIVMKNNGDIEEKSGDVRRFMTIFDEYITDFKLPKDLKKDTAYTLTRPSKKTADWNVEWSINEYPDSTIDTSATGAGRIIAK
jgi:hypothetical protein